MTRRTMLSAALPGAFAISRARAAGEVEPMRSGPYQPDWKSLSNYAVPQWFRDAKFGIWSHWSPQAVPEQGDWYARHMYEPGHPHYRYHIEHYGHPSVFGYKDLLPLFTAQRFRPEEQMELFRRAGAKYFVALASHHDNFDCWDSKHQPWNSARIGPKRDLVGLWRDAALKAGMVFGISVHSERAYYWYEPAHSADKTGPLAGVPYDASLTAANGAQKWWDGLDPVALYCESGTKPSGRFIRQWTNRTKDLINRYHPELLYFDSRFDRFDQFGPLGMEVLAHYYNDSVKQHRGALNAVLNIKAMPPGVDRRPAVMDMERTIPEDIEVDPFQNDTSVGDWHYRIDDKYRNPADIVHLLIDDVSKNGTLLLAVPQRGDGSLDARQIAILEDIGNWMRVGGEAIYETRPWKNFGEGPAVWSGSESAARGGRRDPFTERDFRFTAKGDSVYTFLMAWPPNGGSVRVTAMGSASVRPVINVALLGHNGKLNWRQEANGLSIELPTERPCNFAYPFKVTFRHA